MRERLLLRLTYDRDADTVLRSTTRELTGLSFDGVFGSDRVTKILGDVRNLTEDDIRARLMGDDTRTFVKAYASAEGTCLYVLRIRFRARGICRVTLKRVPLWQKTSHTIGTRIAAAALIIAVIGVGFAFALYLRADMYKKKNAEANDTVGMVSEQIDRTFTSEFNSWFRELEMIGTLLRDYSSLDGKEGEIDDALNSVRESLSFADCGLLFKTGDLYFTESRTYNIAYETLARELVIYRRPAVDVMNINAKEYIVFGIPFYGAARKADTISAICGIAEASSMSDLLSINAFGGQATVSVIKNDGFRVAVSQSDSVEAREYPNLFAIVRNRVSESEFRAFEEQYLSDGTGSLRMSGDGEDGDCLMYFSPLHVGNGSIPTAETWRLVIFVPESCIFRHVNETFHSTMIILVGILSVAIVMLTMFVLMFLRQKNTQMLLVRRAMEVETMETTARQAEEASHAKTVFFANMSHDMRTPLNGILGMSAIAKKHIDDPETVRACIGKIDDASEHLLSLVNNVLDMSRIESRKVEINHEVMNVGMLAEECRSIVEGQIRTRNICFRLDRSGITDENVIGDNLHVRQILINLLGNAIKFTPDGGTVDFTIREVSREENRGTYEFAVRDTGVGMSPEFMKRMFEPFAQEHDGGRGESRGSGLGLSIAHQLAELMGGGIRAVSEEGKGTEMTLWLPFEISETMATEAEERKQSGSDDEAVLAARLKGVRVLLVEDNDINREVAETLLTENGLSVDCAVNGREAYDKFLAHREHAYDVILMDVMMPEMDGIEATKRIRASDHPEAKSVIIIAMTANAFEDDIRRTRAAGMDGHLSKPIRITEILKTIDQLLSPRHEP